MGYEECLLLWIQCVVMEMEEVRHVIDKVCEVFYINHDGINVDFFFVVLKDEKN